MHTEFKFSQCCGPLESHSADYSPVMDVFPALACVIHPHPSPLTQSGGNDSSSVSIPGLIDISIGPPIQG